VIGIKFFSKLTFIPRWVIILIDLLIIMSASVLAYLLRFNFNYNDILSFQPVHGVLLISACCLFFILLKKSYAGIIRYTGIEDGLRVLNTTALGYLMAFVINLLYYYNFANNIIPHSVLIISFFISFLFLLYYRLLVKAMFSYFKGDITNRINVCIFGAGSLGIITKAFLEADLKSKYKVVGFLEDDANKVGKLLQGVPIYSWSDFDKLIYRFNVKELIIAVRNLNTERKNDIVDYCLARHISVRRAPSAEKLLKGDIPGGALTQIKIDDLLGRDEIHIPNDKLYQLFFRKRICITGAAGSIGSELTKQLIPYSPESLILIDQAETPLAALENELMESEKQAADICFYLADITDVNRITSIIKSHRPHIIFHTAAYKHVPVLEQNPTEAIRVNILGSRILADLAVEYGVEKFVLVSTDKAVNPTSIMGCSKRVAEMYVQALWHNIANQNQHITQFIVTRFGNVFGSNGSVIPLFKKQIERGGPITITHPEITRYFMTIPEACRLVLEAGSMGKGGEIFIFDMGKPVRIKDLAIKMIRLSGFEPGVDMNIVYTGLREGEKLHEELLTNKENTLPTHHPKILKASNSQLDYEFIVSEIELMEKMLYKAKKEDIIRFLKTLVPEFQTARQNSISKLINQLG
jgi:FlaA1/EpsC-like NDP-sugar epimerase